MSKADEKEIEETVKRLKNLVTEMKKRKQDITYNKNDDLLQDLDTVLQALENSIPKQVIEEKIIIDTNKLNHSVNGILSEMYKARITLAKELLEGE